jgi:AraC-like DNA-binding protein
MSTTLYTIINWVSAAMIFELGIVLALFKTKDGHEYHKYHAARKWLSVACVTLGVLMAVNQLIPADVNHTMWLRVVVLCIAALQAMMFTMTILSIIAVQKVTRRYILLQTLLIVAGGACVMSVCGLSPEMSRAAFYFGIIAYLLLLGYYARSFIHSFHQFRQEINTYYEEEEINYSLRWIRRLFWSALAVGLLSFLSLTGIYWLDGVFIIIYTAYYIYFTIQFINYHRQLQIVQPAIAKNPMLSDENLDGKRKEDDATGVSCQNERNALIRHMEQGISRWVEEKRYTAFDKSVEDVANEMECTIHELHWYFREVMKTSFPLWRNQLRIEMAKQLLREQPAMKIQEVALQSGFNNRSYFYRKFAELTGMSVQEFKQP